VTTTNTSNTTISVRCGGKNDDHTHAPNREEVEALKITCGVKRTASQHPEAPPAQILRRLQDVPSRVLAELNGRENMRRQIRRVRLKDMPNNPTDIDDFQEIPEAFRKTIQGKQFMLYDSYEDENYRFELRTNPSILDSEKFGNFEKISNLVRRRHFQDCSIHFLPTFRHHGICTFE